MRILHALFVQATAFSFFRATPTRSQTQFSSPSSKVSIFESTKESIFESIVFNRYAAGRFDPDFVIPIPLLSSILKLSLRAPTSFNSQPYRIVSIQDHATKQKLSKFCIGRNADRVRDCSALVVFCADNHSGSRINIRRLRRFFQSHPAVPQSPSSSLRTSLLISFFASSYPFLPRFLSRIISFFVRLAINTINLLKIREQRLVLPTLTSAETWATKNTMLVASTFMLAASSRDLETCPMEGFNQSGIRKVLNLSRKFTIPIIIATGKRLERVEDFADGVGVVHSNSRGTGSKASMRMEDSLTMI
ncbi:hypothetical protein ScalyP_jg4948 [Parmales sp. scaly parma]|nr:hypothetical protein ScalyP_jg4948 [Parmales sp. scaly parma]